MCRALKFGLITAIFTLAPPVRADCVLLKALEKLQGQQDADSYANLGTSYEDRHQYPCATEAYRAGLKLEPRSPRLSYLLGLSLFAGGDVEGAIQPLQQSVQLMPQALKPHLLLADAFEQLARRGDARAQWEAAVQIDPHSVIALDGLSRDLLADGDSDSVIRLLGPTPRGEALSLDLAQAYRTAEMTDRATEVLTKALQTAPSSTTLSSALVTLLVMQAHFEEAASIALKSVRLHPHDPNPKKLYLHVLVLNDDVELARPLARNLLRAMPHDFETLYLNGILERESGDYIAARDHLEEAVALNPTHYNSRYNLGVVLAQMKDPRAAREQLEKAIALGASEPQIRFELANVLRSLGETALAQEQLKLYQQEEQAKANRTLAASKAAQAEKELTGGNPQKAVALYRDAVTAAPENAMLMFKFGLALDRAGDTTGELAALRKAVQLDPAMAIAHNQIGYLASRSGDTATAEEHFRRAVQAAPGYVEAWVSLAATLGMESRYPEAQQALESALRLDPQNPSALQLRKELSAANGQTER